MRKKRKHDPREADRDKADGQLTHTDGDAGAGGHPDPRGGRQPADLSILGGLQNRAAPEEPDTCGDALNHAGQIGRRHATQLRGQDEGGGAQRHQHVGAQARGLADALAIDAGHRADEHGRAESDDDARELLGGEPARAQFIQESIHQPG